MAIIQLSSQTPPTISDFPSYRVQIRRYWSDDWQTIDYLEPLMVHQTIAPSVPMATFRYRYGDIKREDQNAFAFYAPLAVVNWYVRVDAVATTGNQLLFVGILCDDEYELQGATTEPQGDQVISAYGLEHLLDRVSMVGAYVDGDNYISRTPTFNQREQWGGVLSGNRSELSQWDAQFSRDGYKWTHLDIICYALRYFAPPSLNVGLSGAWAVLDNLSGVYEFEGLTVRQVLEKLIDRRRGLGWRIYSDGDVVLVYVFTVFEQDVLINGILYPGNPDTYSQNFDTDREIESVGVAVSQSQLYDKIVVQGARARVCFSVDVESGTLEPAWTSDEQDAYDAAEDADRASDQYQAVYQRYKIPSDWDWTDHRRQSVALAFDDTGTLLDEVGGYWNSQRPLLRQLPIARGDGTDTDNYLPPLAVISNDEDACYLCDKLDAVGKTPASLSMLDAEMGVQLESQYRHNFGLGRFAGSSEYSADWDYDKLICTVAVEADVRPTVTIRLGGEIDTERTLVLTVHDAEYHYVMARTVSGVDAAALVYHDGGTVRDDTDKLRNVAALAASWYGIYRGILKVQLKRLDTSMPPSGLITSVSSAWQTMPVSTVISSVRYDMRAGVTMIETGFSELDFATLLDIPGMSDFRSVGRAFNRQRAEIDSIRKHLSRIPVRHAVPALRDGETTIAEMDFIVDMFDRADADSLGDYWDANSENALVIRGGACWSAAEAVAPDSAQYLTQIVSNVIKTPGYFSGTPNVLQASWAASDFYVQTEQVPVTLKCKYLAGKLGNRDFKVKFIFSVPVPDYDDGFSTSGEFAKPTNISNDFFGVGGFFNGALASVVDADGATRKTLRAEDVLFSVAGVPAFDLHTDEATASATIPPNTATATMPALDYSYPGGVAMVADLWTLSGVSKSLSALNTDIDTTEYNFSTGAGLASVAATGFIATSHNNFAPFSSRSEIEVLVSVAGSDVVLSVDDNTIGTQASDKVEPGGIVGLVASINSLQNYANMTGGGLAGVKFWRADMPEPPSQSGHGKYVAETTNGSGDTIPAHHLYRDKYHTNNGTTDVPDWVYNPLA